MSTSESGTRRSAQAENAQGKAPPLPEYAAAAG